MRTDLLLSKGITGGNSVRCVDRITVMRGCPGCGQEGDIFRNVKGHDRNESMRFCLL